MDAAGAALVRPESLTWVVVGDLSVIEPGVRNLELGDVKVLDTEGRIVR